MTAALIEQQPKHAVRELSELELVERFQRDQNPQDFGILYERYYHLAFGSALKITQNTADAEDITSQVFESLFNKLPQIENIGSFKSYLYTAIRNAAYTHHRRGRNNQEREEKFKNFEKNTSDFVESEAFVSLHKEENERDRKVRNAIRHLREDQRTCLELFYFKDCSYQEIVSKTSYDLGTVKSCLQNGKRNLRRELAKLMSNPSLWWLPIMMLFY